MKNKKEKVFVWHHFCQMIVMMFSYFKTKDNPKNKFQSSYESGAGFVASLTTILVLIFMISIAMSMSVLIFGRQKISTNTINATQSYYTAEAGIEDSLLRLKNNPLMSPLSYALSINNSTANVVIPAIVGGSRAINSQGTNSGLVKTTQVVYAIDSQGVSFFYGAQVGAGGLQMSNGSRVIGSVFSNGNITAGPGIATIDNDVIVAGNGNSINGMRIERNALVYSCYNSNIIGNLTTVSTIPADFNTCTYANHYTQTNEIPSQPMPISQSQIDGWKSDAEAGGTISSVTLSGTQTMSLGPKKITGDLSLSNSAVLTLTGTVYVTGNIIINQSGKIKLDSSYGSLSGIILSDGIISPGQLSVLQGSGQASSYLLVLSNSTSDTAITVGNNASGAIFYASAGGITASQSFSAREATGYKLIMQNNATVTYESGLANAFFTSGPAGGWKVRSWQEK